MNWVLRLNAQLFRLQQKKGHLDDVNLVLFSCISFLSFCNEQLEYSEVDIKWYELLLHM